MHKSMNKKCELPETTWYNTLLPPEIKHTQLPLGLWGNEIFKHINIEAETQGMLECGAHLQDIKTKIKRSYIFSSKMQYVLYVFYHLVAFISSIFIIGDILLAC